MAKPKIAVTMGDPAGVGPEICLDLLSDPEILNICHPVIFGDLSILKECARQTSKSFNTPALELKTVWDLGDVSELFYYWTRVSTWGLSDFDLINEHMFGFLGCVD